MVHTGLITSWAEQSSTTLATSTLLVTLGEEEADEATELYTATEAVIEAQRVMLFLSLRTVEAEATASLTPAAQLVAGVAMTVRYVLQCCSVSFMGDEEWNTSIG